MRFRWIGFLTLWTFLSGPIFALPAREERSAEKPVPLKVKKQQILRPSN
jgi:hypothetical protein